MAYASTYNNVQVPGLKSSGAESQGRNKANGPKKPNFPKAAKVFSCANKHPIQALKELYPDAKFEVIGQYLTNKGAAIVVQTTIKDVVYQGEGVNLKIARTIAAHKALVGVNATDHHKLVNPIDFGVQMNLVMDRIAEWKEDQDKREAKKAEHEKIKTDADIRKAERKNRAEEMGDQSAKKKKDNNGKAKNVGFDYGILMFKYGPDIVDDIIQCEEKTPQGHPIFKCTLKVQGIVFEATSTSKKGARNEAVAQAHTQFTHTPPPVVNEKKRKEKTEWSEFKPVEFQDIIAKECWEFVTEQTESIPDQYKPRRNLVVIVKIEGEDSNDNCEIVAFGSGTLVIKRDSMTADGSRINDSTGESLSLRALRRYLLDQLERCLANRSSVYIKDKTGGKCSLKRDVKLYMYTNSAPMGDCRAYNYSPTPESDTTKHSMETNQGPKIQHNRKKGRQPKNMTNIEDLGKIQLHLTSEKHEEDTKVPNEDSHCIVSPSDKLAMRQVCGVQGSVLWSLSNPVYIAKYFIGRKFDEETLTRALYTRVKAGNVSSREIGPMPAFSKVTWKNDRMTEKKSPWSLIWAEGHAVEVISAAEGKAFRPERGEEPAPDKLTQSRYSTKALYAACSDVCRKYKIKYPQKYSLAKSATTRYRTNKNAILTHLKESGMGAWPETVCKPNY